MASAAVGNFWLPHPTTLCPPPLHIHKKPRRTTIRRRLLRKSTNAHNHRSHGPLDDIINEIKSNIWELPPNHSPQSSVLDWASSCSALPTWSATPLPLSRAPSDQPLTVRKNRNSRSSASVSSMGDPPSKSRNGSQEEANTTPWPSFDTAIPHEYTNTTDLANRDGRVRSATARRGQEYTINRTDGHSDVRTQRRPSRLRLFTDGFPRLRRTPTGETSAGTADTSETTSPTTTALHFSPDDINVCEVLEEPSDKAVEAYLKRHAHNGTRLRAMMDRMAKRLPCPAEDLDSHELDDPEDAALPSTLRAAIRIFPEAKRLSDDLQNISIAVEVEGVLHNRQALKNTTVDVIFVVDNGYDLTVGICRYSTQTWQPARPNPSMTDVILGVARSLEGAELKLGRTHVILLSPAAHILHDVSQTFPDLYIHRINPAALPYRREPASQDAVCYERCCKNVFVSNWRFYQSVPGRIKRILKNARSKAPMGELTDLSIDLRAREGCDIIECFGQKDVPCLRLGQVHTFFARIRVKKEEAKHVDLQSINPVFNSSLDVKGLRQDLQNAVTLGATKVHILDVQLYHRNTINTVDCWNYTEAPLIIIEDLGGLAHPVDVALEVYKRQYFHKFVQLTTDEARVDIDHLLAIVGVDNELARKILGRMAKEIQCQEEIRKYERELRQKLPLCPGPIEIEVAHEWLQDIWNKRKTKRNGVAGVAGVDVDVSGLIDGFHGMKRLRLS
ncbi:hypothetical protein EK21DRAFT_51494 [Setomelanomma holmii]|uniref:Uncharacterized protein n=1 Tax=Setomelanomma holmii TaxID=210430 RepID=A0A9P4LQU4_9PLEO|nr:hypothetical protein EK21DRAFT_51494 [Setomelanomma holmii]